MFGLRPKLPILDDARQWVDEGFVRLSNLLGRERMLKAQAILPNDEYFPDHYDTTEPCVRRMFKRVCHYMKVDHETVELHVFPDETEELRKIMPYWSGGGSDCAGVFFDDKGDSPRVVGVKSSQLKDPLALVATLAHELGHVILLGERLVEKDEPDMEPMTDLVTVYLGLGIFTGNSSERFRKFQEERKIGWSMQRLGYLPQPMFGYALAKFAAERGEARPGWKKYLSTNLKADFARSHEWIVREEKSRGASC